MDRSGWRREYQINIIYEPLAARYRAEVPELEGCTADGMSYEDAFQNALKEIGTWIAIAEESDFFVPLPKGRRTHSGKFVLRLPVELHGELTLEAAVGRTSLNALVTQLVEDGLRDRRASREAARVHFKKRYADQRPT